MKKYCNHTIKEYLDCLSAKVPAPGGGSAAALVGANGAALISMVANYSKGKGKSKKIEAKIKATLAKSENIKRKLLALVDLDAQAYLGVVKAKKNGKARKAALKRAQKVPLEVCKLCYSAMELTPFLVKEGNQYLISDIQVAVELLLAAFDSAMINIHINQ